MLGNCLGGEWRQYLQLSQPPSNVPDGGGGGDYDDGGDDDDAFFDNDDDDAETATAVESVESEKNSGESKSSGFSVWNAYLKLSWKKRYVAPLTVRYTAALANPWKGCDQLARTKRCFSRL